VAHQRIRSLAQSADEQVDQAPCVVVGVVVGADAKVADPAHQCQGIDVGTDLAGRGCGVEQLSTDRHEALGEVGMQCVEPGVVGLQYGGESVLGDQEIDE